MDMDAQLSWFPAQAGQLASYLVLYFGYFGYGNLKGTTLFLFKKKKIIGLIVKCGHKSIPLASLRN
jgi:hypothetical protein